MKKEFVILCLLAVAATNLFSRENAFLKISGPYLGQKPPGLTPEIFAPGIVSTGLDELNSAFSPDGSEFYFCVRNIAGGASIFEMKMKEGAWREPRLLPFASRFGDIDVSISPAGDALLFSSLRPRPGSTEPRKDNDFWMAVREGREWGDPVHLGPGINSESHDYYPLMARGEAIYFSSQREGPGTNNIYRSERKDGAYVQAVKLPEAVNTQYREFDPYVTPAEDMLIFASNRPGGRGLSDLYVCFRDAGGAWTNALNLGEKINSPGPEFCPILSPDGKYLFFTSNRFEQASAPETPVELAGFSKAHNMPGNGLGDIYWVDAGIIETLRIQALAASAPAVRQAGREPLTLTRIANSGVMLASGGTKIAIVTFVSSPDQEKLVNAMIKSIRERGGGYWGSMIFVVTTDAENLPCKSLKQDGVEVLPLEMERTFLDHPLALKAFAAAQVEKKVVDTVTTLIWLDPGVVVLKPLEDLDLGNSFDAAVRPVTLANTIALPPQTPPNDYWGPIYGEVGLDYKTLPALKTIVDEQPIQPYYNCEVFSFNPRLGLAAEWARLLARFLKDENFQKTVCTTFLRKLFLHQAVLSAVISARIKPERIKELPLTNGYPFNQHDELPAAKKAAALNDLAIVIFDYAWDKIPNWMEKIKIEEPLKSWLFNLYRHYLEIAPQIYRIEGRSNSYLVVTKKGSVLIDPAGASVAPEFFKKILEQYPLKAILLTHAHPDHSDDIDRWQAEKKIPVIAQREFKRYSEYVGELEGFFARRNAIWAGKRPAAAPAEQSKSQAKPTVYFSDEYELELGNLHFKMLHRPGETPDHIAIWIPELKAVFVGDNYFEYFINNSTFRGTMIRPVLGYIEALGIALAFEPEYFFMGHGSPIVSQKAVKKTVGDFRDAITYIHDETIKGINAGKDVHTLMNEIKLPEKYAIPQYFGKVEWTVRGIWQEYVGWFDENPSTMYASPLSDLYPDLVTLAGEEKILQRAQDHLSSGDFMITLHLTEIVLKVNPLHKNANEIRIKALNGLKSGTRNFIEKIWLNHAIRLCEENLETSPRN